MNWIKAGFRMITGGSGKGSDNVMKVANGVGGWIDEQQFTDEEKSKFRGEVIEHYSRFVSNTVNENSERSKSRREIAILIIRFELALLLASAIAFKFDVLLSEYLFRLATQDPMSYLVLGVGAFFFSAHLIRTAKG